MTDVVGSVALWEQSRSAASNAIEQLESLTEKLAALHRGIVHKKRGEGDSFFLTFEQPADAICFAVNWTEALEREPWPAGFKIQCRVAIRTGSAEDRNGDYYGVCVNRCARMRSLASRCQIILCEATHSLVRDQLPSGSQVHSLGAVSLRDIERPESLFLLQIDGIDSSTKLESSSAATNHNMPPRLTSFVGREVERERIESELRFHRLITLLGPGGSGKTRISEEIAEDFALEMTDGAWFVPLAECRSADEVVASLHRSLRSKFQLEHQEMEAIVTALAAKHCLLVIDNCEHLVQTAAKLVHTILAGCPRIRVLATSRNPLGLVEEHVLAIGPFDVPDSNAEFSQLEDSQAVRLFMERAKAKDSSLMLTAANSSAIVRICKRLDGIALAIEQAASHAGRLSISQIADRLETSFGLLRGTAVGTDPRHETMIATIRWSTELLDSTTSQLFFALPVFVGSWNLEAAESICGSLGLSQDEALDAHGMLVDASLVQRFEHPDVGTRYRFLETVKEFASSENPPSRQVCDAQMNWCLKLAEEADGELLGPNQARWLRQLEWEGGNIRQALEWADGNSYDILVNLAASLKRYWVRSGLFQEGAYWLERALAVGPSAEPRLRAQILNALGACRWRLGESDVAEVHYRESLAIWEAIGDQAQIGALYTNLAICATDRGDWSEAIKYYETAATMQKTSRDKVGLGSTLMNLSNLNILTEHWTEADESASQAIELLQFQRNLAHLGYAYGNKARAAWKLLDTKAYQEFACMQVELFLEQRDANAISLAIFGIAQSAFESGNSEIAGSAIDLALALAIGSGTQSDWCDSKNFAQIESWLHSQSFKFHTLNQVPSASELLKLAKDWIGILTYEQEGRKSGEVVELNLNPDS